MFLSIIIVWAQHQSRIWSLVPSSNMRFVSNYFLYLSLLEYSYPPNKFIPSQFTLFTFVYSVCFFLFCLCSAHIWDSYHKKYTKPKDLFGSKLDCNNCCTLHLKYAILEICPKKICCWRQQMVDKYLFHSSKLCILLQWKINMYFITVGNRERFFYLFQNTSFLCQRRFRISDSFIGLIAYVANGSHIWRMCTQL